MAQAQDHTHIGTRPIRPDGLEKVTGKANFGADTTQPGMLHGAVLRSPHAHAQINAIDPADALALDGVYAVVTAADFPARTDISVGRKRFFENILASKKTLYNGHPIAAVAAQTKALAEQAAQLIRVDYTVLEHVLDMREAMQPDAPLLHEDMFTQGLPTPPEKPSNISQFTTLTKGDVAAGFAQADVIIERTFTTPMVHQGYLEPHACVADKQADGNCHLWCSSQGHFGIRDMAALALGMDTGQICVQPAEIGGGFGGKTVVYLEPLAIKLSEKTGRPVKMVMTRDEVFRATGPAPGTINTVKIGCTRDGKITAMAADLLFESGAFPGSPLGAGAMCIFAPYDVANIHIEGNEVVVNKPRVAAYRAPGAPQAMFAGESVLDELAQALGLDPIDLRLLNAAKEGSRATYGPKFKKIGFIECLQAAKSHPHYSQPLGANQGRGVAAGFWFNAGNNSSAEVHVAESGMIQIVEGSPDIGGSRAAMAIMAAEKLQIPYERIKVRIGDTQSTGFCNTTGGSRTTFATGMAVINACDDIINQLKGRAALTWGIEADQVDWHNGSAHPKPGINVDAPPLTLAKLARAFPKTGGPISARASLNAQGPGPSFAVNLCDVEIDPDTGKTHVVRYTAIQDAGRAIHPDYVEGQMQGGAAQGIGWALNEAYVYNHQGAQDNPGFLDYRIPVASDLPMIDTKIVEVHSDTHPYGVRGVGETPIVAPLAAVASAVSHAIGKRMPDLPLTPERVLDALEQTR
ncbi:MAG: xanthine dehydrogenase family protein molybdopterin-binding subunit [Gammaproteobacteria bacterium]|nr:xanthine dehydrogenase family protein molybdopterin-binding subunit [Gammaproteobacteria bacterium]